MENKRIGLISMFICTVYKWVYALSITLGMVITTFVLNCTKNVNNLTFLIMATVQGLMISIAYIISLLYKRKKEKLEVVRVSIPKQIIFTVVSVVYALVILILTTLLITYFGIKR